jgi:DNA-binding NtrC family response regulator
MRVATPTEARQIRVLLTSRDAVYARFLAERLVAEGMLVVRPEQPALGTVLDLDASAIDVVLVETHGLDDAAWAVVELVRERAPLIEIIAISSEPMVDSAVEALRNGVFSILTYPVTDGQLVNEITRACARKRHGEARLKATERRTS